MTDHLGDPFLTESVQICCISCFNLVLISECLGVGVANVITSDKFFGDRLRGVDSVGGGVENCPFPSTKAVAVNTGLALLRSL